ncbi:MAG: hypothetical protein KDJ29_04970 [Hyphomicrobiales bacterium]|nr:hypothetical protein [Hyphomicrobiales bacterium]
MQMTTINDRTVQFDNAEEIQIFCNGKEHTLGPGQAIFFEDEAAYEILFNPAAGNQAERFSINVTGWQECTDDGFLVVGIADQMAEYRDSIIAAKEAESERIALNFITPGYRKMMSYEEKYREALAYKADTSAPAEILRGEAKKDGMTIVQKVNQVLARRDAWKAAEVLINDAIVALKNDLDAAKTIEEIRVAKNAFAWPEGLPAPVG